MSADLSVMSMLIPTSRELTGASHDSALRFRENVRSGRDETTVGRQRSAGEPACVVGGEKCDYVSDVLRLPETA